MVQVRALRADDFAEWKALWHGYQSFYGHPNRGDAFFETAFARLISGDARDFQALVAEDEGRLLGLTHFVFHPNLWRPEGVCYLQDLFTAPEARGRGVARALIEAVYTAADARGVPSVYWLTAEDNAAAPMLYDRVAENTGFIRYARR
ncbi:MAG: GNAT family N-acetyltransferase [Paracoccus sp. (in: a-proteobacteria)]|nr:GNAT family N-acetyltransferase [Paracoccus sp. (in: a-proteobacteria)]